MPIKDADIQRLEMIAKLGSRLKRISEYDNSLISTTGQAQKDLDTFVLHFDSLAAQDGIQLERWRTLENSKYRSRIIPETVTVTPPWTNHPQDTLRAL